MYSDARHESEHLQHSSHARPGTLPFPDRLYVITPIANPMRYSSRYEHYRAFEKRVLDAGAVLYTIEAAYGGRPFEVTSADNPQHFQVRSNSEVWLKENLINLAIQRLPLDAKYIAWVDADLTFSRPDWVQETLHQLQHFDFVQMWSHLVGLGPNSQVIGNDTSFMEGWTKFQADPLRRDLQWYPEQMAQKIQPGEFWAMNADGSLKSRMFFASQEYGNGPQTNLSNEASTYSLKAETIAPEWYGAPGGAWAATRAAISAVGGLIDWVPTGSADYYLALGLMGKMDFTVEGGRDQYDPAFVESLLSWQENAVNRIRGNVGHVSGTILHHWHGSMKQRGYGSRWQILTRHHFDPRRDLIRNSQGVYELAGHKPGLRDDLRNYFRSRNEDSIEA